MDNNNNVLSNEELQKAFKHLQGEGKNVQFVDLNDEFEFNCNRCGSCCTCRNDILVSPYDVYDLAVALKINCIEVISKYLEPYIGQHSHIPIMVIADTPQRKCPFLEFDTVEMLYKCKVDSKKPGPCRTYPFGVVRQTNPKTLEPEIVSFIKTDFCKMHGGKKITVKEHIGEDYLKSLDARTESYKLQSFVANLLNLEKIHAIINGDETYNDFSNDEKDILLSLTEDERNMIKMMYMGPYIDVVYSFNPGEDFLSQCKNRFKEVVKFALTFRAALFSLGFEVKHSDTEKVNNSVNKYMSLEESNSFFEQLKENVAEIEEMMKETKEL